MKVAAGAVPVGDGLLLSDTDALVLALVDGLRLSLALGLMLELSEVDELIDGLWLALPDVLSDVLGL